MKPTNPEGFTCKTYMPRKSYALDCTIRLSGTHLLFSWCFLLQDKEFTRREKEFKQQVASSSALLKEAEAKSAEISKQADKVPALNALHAILVVFWILQSVEEACMLALFLLSHPIA
eukprot:553919-Pelagomonas_calceolata.AAC.1